MMPFVFFEAKMVVGRSHKHSNIDIQSFRRFIYHHDHALVQKTGKCVSEINSGENVHPELWGWLNLNVTCCCKSSRWWLGSRKVIRWFRMAKDQMVQPRKRKYQIGQPRKRKRAGKKTVSRNHGQCDYYCDPKRLNHRVQILSYEFTKVSPIPTPRQS